jgi:hypothetical protein
MSDDKHKRKLMMEYNAEEVYQRRKKRWLIYGRALLTIGILGLITIALYAITHSRSSLRESESIKVLVIDDRVDSDQIVEERNNGRKAKRAIDLRSGNEIKVPKNIQNSENVQSHNNNNDNNNKNDVNSGELVSLDTEHAKLFRREQTNSDVAHRHSEDGTYYIFKGYKCIPIRKPSKQLENKRARQRVGMCVYQ